MSMGETMRKIAVYGKGGIGKSTVTSALSAALAYRGYRVMQVGCDPKADSTINLTGGNPVVPIMEYLKIHGTCRDLGEIVREGYRGVICAEAGGPSPGIGCAGRGIITAFNLLEELNAYDRYQPDVVLYDVLGDVVCGGFAMPIRQGYADEVLIVSSGEKMALYAANNIKTALDNFSGRNYAVLRGLILNRRGVDNEDQLVADFAAERGIPIVGTIPRDNTIHHFEEKSQTVVEGNPELPISKVFLDLAASIMNIPCSVGAER
jgi:nitrogenase iron protein NifH